MFATTTQTRRLHLPARKTSVTRMPPTLPPASKMFLHTDREAGFPSSACERIRRNLKKAIVDPQPTRGLCTRMRRWDCNRVRCRGSGKGFVNKGAAYAVVRDYGSLSCQEKACMKESRLFTHDNEPMQDHVTNLDLMIADDVADLHNTIPRDVTDLDVTINNLHNMLPHQVSNLRLELDMMRKCYLDHIIQSDHMLIHLCITPPMKPD